MGSTKTVIENFWLFAICICLLGLSYKVGQAAKSIDNIDLFPSCTVSELERGR